jgi:apolipoprotein N-acyltransferase
VQGSPRLGASSQEIARTQAALTATLAGSGADLIVWPESSMEGDPASDPGLLEPLLASIRRTRAYFVVGTTLDATGRRFRNVSLFYRPDGTLADTYVKIHLVPFGEYVPGRALLAGWIHELGRVPLDGIAGKVPEVFSLPQGKVGTVICYETAYPGLVRSFVRRGARLIIVSTNNSSYLRTAASAQMVAISQLRAAEQRMWVVQAALTGISAVIGPNGHLVDRTALFRPTALTPTVRFATGTTPYARFGDWLPIAAMLAGVGLAASAGARGTRREVA